RAGSDADDARDPAPVAASGDDDRLHRIAVVLNPSKFAETASIRQRLSELAERIEGAETVFYQTTIDDPRPGQGEQAPRDDADRLHRIAVVLNPSKFAQTESIRQRLSELVERTEGAETVFYETTIDDPGQGHAEQALREGAGLVMAAGGDGTVRMVASVLAGTGVPMGIIPAGTGNLLARNVEVPLEDPGAAMTAALTGEDRQVDVGWL